MIENDLLNHLFSFNTEHWVKVELNGKERIIKYIPLSIKEKLNIINKYKFSQKENETNIEMVQEFCKLMLRKAYKDDVNFNADSIPLIHLSKIYKILLEDINERKKEIESFYEENKTKPLKTSKSKSNKLDPMINVCNISKECNISLANVSDLDEVSLFCLMIYMIEVNTRESNSYEEARSK